MDDRRNSRFLALLWTMILAASVAVPLFVSPHGRDVFRVPKLALFQGTGIVLGTLILVGMVFGWISRADFVRHRGPLILTAAILGWTAVTAAVSYVPRISWESFLTVFAGASFFVAVLLAAPRRPLRDLVVLTLGAVVNSVVVILQATHVWTPLETTESGRLAVIGLIGNPNDVSTFLLCPAIAAAALAMAARQGLLRWYGAAAAALMCVAVLMTESTTGVAAAATAACLMAFTSFRVFGFRRRTVTIALAALVIAALFVGSARLISLSEQFTRGGLDATLSGRLLAFAAAAEMVRAHPVTGVGPGMFSWHYFEFAPVAAARYGPFPYASSMPVVFSEAHNDHLQIAAETGIPGLLLFWSALALLIVRTVFRRSDTEPRTKFAMIAGAPLAGSFAVLCVAQFPLQLAASVLAVVITSGLCLAWSSQESES